MAPAVSSTNNYNWPILKNFPKKYQDGGRERCQWLAKDESTNESKKFLFVCREEGYEPDFYFYSESQNPTLISKWEQKGDTNGKGVEVTVTLDEDTSTQEQQITISSPVWEVLKNKNGVSSGCSLVNSEDSWRSWTLKCGTEGGKDIPLTPMIW
ncbi:hypothetical protein [Mycoplasma wenyonii]|uniref:hypothetical protein n=1 Tax=Mycoplasma wenyonii TaxID=65123 RepID=UPI001305488E|nr:hypothetical protein [Mycoplasma wenyonii]